MGRRQPRLAPNSMLYLILSPNFITVVLDDPNTAEMRRSLNPSAESCGIFLILTRRQHDAGRTDRPRTSPPGQ